MNEVKEARGVRSRRYDGKKSEVELHYLGLSAELAFGKLVGLEPNFEITLHGDSGWDFRTKNGLTIEVKLRAERGGDFALVAPTLEGMRADIGVLMWPSGEKDGYEFVGWTTRVHAAQKGRTVKLLSDRYLVRWQDLIEPEKLLEII